MLKKLFLFNFVLFLASLSLNAQTVRVSKETPNAVTEETRRQAFEKVWTTVNEKHYDPTFGGVDWQGVRLAYEPKALAAKTDAEFHAVLRQMLGELKLSHFAVYQPPADAKTTEFVRGTIGIKLKIIDG
ncbi:MAG TPA: hypothetical protein VK308_15540 [Pyrinomonadaceae bacterium]|nr:hypothetical protein [Pyrinomonadaceae bacterium]